MPDAPPWLGATEAAAAGLAAASAPQHTQSATATPERAPPQPPVAEAVAVRQEPGPPGPVELLLERVEQLEEQLAHLFEVIRGQEACVIAFEETAEAEHWQGRQPWWERCLAMIETGCISRRSRC